MSQQDRKHSAVPERARADTPTPAGRGPDSRADIDSFLGHAGQLAPAAGDAAPAGRLVFALDATLSRQPTWDLATRLQAEMFQAISHAASLSVQLMYFRGYDECRASRWVNDATSLTGLMNRIDCRGGETQIARVLHHVAARAGEQHIAALVYVGDAMEESIDHLCALAGQLGLKGVKAFMFQEGGDPHAETAFREIARLTGGAYARFDAGAAAELAGLLRAAAVYASGGHAALARLAGRGVGDGEGARKLIAQMTGRS